MTPLKNWIQGHGTHVAAIGAALSLLALYIWSMPPTVALEDDGLFILSAYFAGVSHPPGYPLHSLLAHLATEVPLGTVAERVHAVSAVFAAGSVALVIYILRLLQVSILACLAAAILLGTSEVFWSQAIIAEVYSLNAFLFLVLLLISLKIFFNPGSSSRLLPILAFAYGLALTNHWPLIGLSSIGLVLLLWNQLQRIFKTSYILAPCLFAGLLPYALMVANSISGPEISFLGPLDSLSEISKFILREHYSQVDNSSTAGYLDKIKFIIFFADEISTQFSPVGLLIGFLGILHLSQNFSKQLVVALLIVFFSNSLILILILNFDFDRLMSMVFRVYPIISYVVFATFIGVGLQCLWGKVCRLRNQHTAHLAISTSILAIFVLSLPFSASKNIRNNYSWSTQYASAVFERIEPDSVFFVSGDIQVGVLSYFNRILGMRPDIELYNPYGLFFSNRIFDHNSPQKQRAENVASFLNQDNRRVYTDTDFIKGPKTLDLWLAKKVVKDSADNWRPEDLQNQNRMLIDLLTSHPDTTDPWTREQIRRLKAEISRQLVIEAASVESESIRQEKRALIESMFDSFSVGVAMLDQIFKEGATELFAVDDILNKTIALQENDELKNEQHLLWLYAARHFSQMGKHELSAKLLERSAVVWPHNDNIAIRFYLENYDSTFPSTRVRSIAEHISSSSRKLH